MTGLHSQGLLTILRITIDSTTVPPGEAQPERLSEGVLFPQPSRGVFSSGLRPVSGHEKGDIHTNVPFGIRRRPTLPGRFQPSTISVLRLNFCVRDGNRWIPQAIVTGNSSGSLPFAASLPLRLAPGFAPSKPHRSAPLRSPDLGSLRFASDFPHNLFLSPDQALDRLVSSSSIRCRTSTDDLSTLSSSRGLTCSRSGNSLLWGGFTLRCLQRLSRPHFASLLCRWHDNSCTRGASIPVLSY